ncbi:N,N'-diacetylbacillosaminyl-diphospho-undecaprenol alpha-1,3-N-acetylgalactosaminyltransferase [compost metagenome]|uniref:Glycosyltransferase family 1 protein n=1 Tax=Sphingobacterium puteale TaxID=2420510 RepID=A0A420VV11_9SPHI|nr:glycosyltransferase family 4 protein [Sphingobacterium puteale]RKO70105.1 glycosyltransferase family 1 protein [Sphingobacterium puteale]
MAENRKKVLIACDSPRTLLDFRGKLIEELIKKNEVFVYTPKISQQHVQEKLKNLGVTVFENHLNGSNVSILSDLTYMIQLYKVIRKLRPDIFFPYTFKPVIYGTIIAKLCGIDCITPMLTGLGYNFTDNGSKKSIVSLITKTLLKFSLMENRRVRIIFQNRDDYNKLIESGIIGIKHQAFVVNGSGVDLGHYDYSEPETTNISFLMISRLINAKGVNEFFEAAKTIRSKYPDIKFRLIGSFDDNIDSINKELYFKIQSGDTLEYIGQVDDVRPYIKNSSIVVLPSYYGEGVPRCILEGMAMGRAIITSDSVGCRETVNVSPSCTNGFLVPVKNIPALASKMEHYINNTRDIISYGINGRKFAKEKFDVNLVNAEMLKIMNVG